MPKPQQVGTPAAGFGRRVRGFLTQQRTFWVWTERLLLASGLVLLAIHGAARIDSLLQSRAAIRKFEVLSNTPRAVLESEKNEVDEPLGSLEQPQEGDFSQWSRPRIEAYKDSATKQGETSLAILEIPKIHLQVPVLNGTDGATLNHAIGRIAGTSRPGEAGNMGIAGHRDGFFRGLKDLKLGDSIELKTLQGSETYLVDQIQIVAPSDISVLRQRSQPSLTLVTCYPFYFIGSAPQRYVISASLSGEVAASHTANARPAATKSNTKGETQ